MLDDMPKDVRAAFEAIPEPARSTLEEIRALIGRVAGEVEAGPLTECLKWGEPAYLTMATGSGSTIRLGVSKKHPGRCGLYLNCQTDLVETCRSRFPEVLTFEGKRGILVEAGSALPEGPLGQSIALALTYHRAKRKRKIGA